MAIQFDATTRSNELDAIDDRFNAGTPPAILEIKTGAPPANTGTADSGTLLATLTFSNPAFGAASAGVMTASAITSDSSADASGTPGHFRVKQGGTGTVVCQGTAAVGSGDLNFNATISLGGTVGCSSFVFTAGNA